MSKFQIILTGVFASFIILGLIVFSVSRGSSEAKANITVWGTMPKATFQLIYGNISSLKDKNFVANYTEKDPKTFDSEFINALASGIGPDVVIIPHESVLKHSDKIFPIPYDSFSERDFRNSFIEQAEIYLFSDGVYSMPIAIDPLVMYWNRDDFTSAGIANPPRFWDEFFNLSQSLTVKDDSFNVLHSAVALGEYRNIDNAKEIISTLIMQAGSPIVGNNKGQLRSLLLEKGNLPIIPADSAISFYTQFSNPSKPYYTWNRSLPNSQVRFIGGDSSVYFGFASELGFIRFKNPNLNFDLAPVPQTRGGGRSITFGRMWGASIVKASNNILPSFNFITSLIEKDTAEKLSEALRIPPVRRDLLANTPGDPYLDIFYQSALWSKAWLDPNPDSTGVIFQELIESITSGRADQSKALETANASLNNLLSK